MYNNNNNDKITLAMDLSNTWIFNTIAYTLFDIFEFPGKTVVQKYKYYKINITADHFCKLIIYYLINV